MSSRTIADAFGPEVADELAKWAIDALVHGELSERRHLHAHAAKVPWKVIEEGRGILEAAGVDWRGLLRTQQQRYREASVRVDAERRRRRIVEQEGS